MSRKWQTTFVSMIFLSRLDKTMINRESGLLLRRLDKVHLSYMNHVRMEHWYNNGLMNGYCEISIESMIYSQFYKQHFFDIWSKQKEKF